MPLHPAVVHYPIAFLCMAAVLRVWLLWRSVPWGEASARLCLWVGTLMLAAAVLSGQANLPPALAPPAADVLAAHQRLGFFLLLWYGGVSLWELARMQGTDVRERLLLTAAHLVGSALLLLTASYGGTLVYEFGVGVRKG